MNIWTFTKNLKFVLFYERDLRNVSNIRYIFACELHIADTQTQKFWQCDQSLSNQQVRRTPEAKTKLNST